MTVIAPQNGIRPIALACMGTFGLASAWADTGGIQVSVSHPNLAVTIPSGITMSNPMMLVVPRNSPLPASYFDFRDTAFMMSREGSRTYTNGTTVTPVLGSKKGSCQNLPCTLNMTINNPTDSGSNVDGQSGHQWGWNAFVDGDYDLLVQNDDTQNTTYAVPFSYSANAAPVASNVAITGTAQAGAQLSGGYTYSDTESNPQGTTTFRWVRNNVNTGVAGGTDVAATQNYTPVNADVGNFLYFCVTPVASAGTATGAEVCSVATAAVAAAPVNGACGNSANVATAFIPAANLCSAGTASTVTPGASSWAWSCTGTGPGATNATCSAPYTAVNGGGGTVGAIQTPGTNGWQINQAASGFVALPAPAPAGVTLPGGATKVVLNTGTAGSSTTVTLRFSSIPAGAQLYKYGKENGIGDTDKWFAFPATIDTVAGTVTYTLTDGQRGDNDWTANGVIDDPVGLGVASGAGIAGVPTLSQWGMMLLAGLMALATFLTLRRRSA